MAVFTTSFATNAALDAAYAASAPATSITDALSTQQSVLAQVLYEYGTIIGTPTSTMVQWQYFSGDIATVRGTNLFGYPATITRIDVTSSSTGATATIICSVTSYNEYTDPSGSISSQIVRYPDGKVVTLNMYQPVPAGMVSTTITSLVVEKAGLGITFTGSLFVGNGYHNGIYTPVVTGTVTQITVRNGSITATLGGVNLDYTSIENASATEILALALQGDDSIAGTTGGQELQGFGGNDTLDGKAGNDTMTGGTGDDTYIVDAVGDVVIEAEGEGTDRITTSLASFSLAALANIENLNFTGSSAFTGTGNAANNSITGNAGNDTLDGGAGDDTLVGGAGNDTYIVDSAGDVVIEQAGAGTDIVRASSSSYTLGNNIEQLIYTGSGNFAGTGSLQANTITGGAGSDTLDGGGGSDNLIGGLGDDIYVVDVPTDIVSEAAGAGSGTDLVLIAFTAAGTYTLTANVENATVTSLAAIAVNVTGNELANDIRGHSGNNSLLGGLGDDTLSGLGGVDTIDGGAGQDTLRVLGNFADYSRSVESATDTRLLNWATGEEILLRGIENVVFLDGMRTIEAVRTGVADGNANVLTGDDDVNLLDGRAGSDTLYGLGGNDTLIGGAGIDLLVGGLGDDTYVVDVTTDVVVEAAGEGMDTVRVALLAAGNYVLTANVENAVVANATAGVAVTGNGLDNVLTSTAGSGNNTLSGLAGNDTYVIDSASDAVVEALNAGTDRVHLAFVSNGSYTLTANVENALVTAAGTVTVHVTGNELANVITGNAANNSLSGLAGDDALDGGAGDDTLDGGAGIDTLTGGTGNDVFIVDSLADVIVELDGGGTDTIRTALASYSLLTTANVENLIYTGTGSFTGTGNELANIITGASGNDSLSGGAGVDTLIGGVGNDTLDGGLDNDMLDGGLGNDTYIVDSTLDVIVEAAGAGTDTVLSSVNSYTLANNIENLSFTGSGNFTGTGNGVANVITGGAGHDTLDGGAGADTLVGGAGHDVFVLDTISDVVTELPGGGIDLVRLAFTTASTYTLTANVENAVVTAANNVTVNVTGNELDNSITGNGTANILNGGAGNDTLNGGAGNDTLDGGLGNDLIIGGLGVDVANFATSSSTATITLDAQDRWILTSTLGTDTLDGIEGLQFTDGLIMLRRPSDIPGNALVVNTYLPGTQYMPASAVLANGAHVVTWTSGGQDGTSNNVYAQRYNAAGERLGDETLVTTTTHGNQERPAIAGLADGGYVIAWQSADANDWGIFVQQFASNGTRVGEERLVNTETTAGQMLPKIVALADGGYVVAWDTQQSFSSNSEGLRFQRYDASGNAVGSETAMVYSQSTGAYAFLADGSIATTSYSLTDGAWYMLVRKYDMSGARVGNDILVTTNFYYHNYTASIAALADGAFAVVWRGTTNAAEFGVVLARTYSATGVASAEIRLSTAANAAAYNVSATALADGGFLVSWVTSSGANLYVRKVSSTGAPVGSEMLLASMLPYETSIAATADGGWLATWTGNTSNGTDIFTQRFDANGALLASGRQLSGNENANTLNYTGDATVMLQGLGGNDSLAGGSGNDTLDGGTGNDTLNGGGGNDSMIGGAGDDTYVVDAVDDVIVEAAAAGNDTVRTTLDTYTLAANLEQLVYTGAGNFTGTGNAVANTLTGSSGHDTLDGAGGIDSMAGGAGNDTYILDVVGDIVTEGVNAGTDEVRLAFTATSTYTMTANVENATVLSSSAIAVHVTGNAQDNLIIGHGGSNSLLGMAGNDTLQSGGGNDTLDGGDGEDRAVMPGNFSDYTITRVSATDTLLASAVHGSVVLRAIESVQFADGLRTMGQVWNNTISAFGDMWAGTSGNDSVNGLAGNDTLSGLDGNDTLIGGAGTDSMLGGNGNDTYEVDVPGDIVIELANEGTDQVNVAFASAGTYVMTAHVENSTVTTAVSNVNVTGNDLNNLITGGAGANSLAGGAGNDTLIGGIGSDTMAGGTGDDEYWLDVASDVVVENLNEGIDTVKLAFTSASSYTMTANVENAQVSVASGFAVHVAGNALGNLITGHAGNNSLSGLAGNDTLVSNGGNDTLDGGDGVDTAQLKGLLTDYAITRPSATTTLLTYLPDGTSVTLVNVENLEFEGTAGTTLLSSLTARVGSPGADTLSGGAGSDTLSGAAGNDSLAGGAGDDDLQGGDGLDTLWGGAGNDILDGGAGNDTYLFNIGDGDDIVDQSDAISTGDVVLIGSPVGNYASGETTLTRGWHSYNDLVITVNSGPTGAEQADHLVINDFFLNDALNSAGAIDLIRFASDNSTLSQAQIMAELLKGTSGDDWLRGYEASADSINGGAGNDTIGGAGGNDTLIGATGNDMLYGDAGNDSLDGGAGNDSLLGGEGNDILAGGAGNDALAGGNGNDTYAFALSGTSALNSNHDVITDASGDSDAVTFSAGILASATQVARSGNDLVVRFSASAHDSLTIENYFSSPGSGATATGSGLIEKFNFADGTSWASTSVLQKVLAATDGDDFISGYLGGENLSGGNGNDTLYGNEGNDSILGGAGDDQLFGGIGADTLSGGAGNDTLTGGDGADRFVLDSATGVDVITDFISGIDKIAISKSVFSSIAGSVGSSATLASLGSAVAYDSATGTLSYDADGAGGSGPVTIAIIGQSTHPATLSSDFLILA